MMRTKVPASHSAASESAIDLIIQGVSLRLHPSGALWWETQKTLIVADLHLEKGASYARRGAFLPPYDSRATLNRLSAVAAQCEATRIILLGDSFHDLDGMHCLPNAERETLERLQAQCHWIWITGNHDPSISKRLGGEVTHELHEDGLVFRHEPSDAVVEGEISGHLHPVARIIRHGRTIRRRCFIENGARMVVPAFGSYAGGLNVCDVAFDAAFRSLEPCLDPRIWMLGEAGVFKIKQSELKPD